MKKFSTLTILLGAALAGQGICAASADNNLPFQIQAVRQARQFRIYQPKKSYPVPLKNSGSIRYGEIVLAPRTGLATSVKWPFSVPAATVPGTLLITVTDRAEGKINNINWKFNFNLAKGRNGSAGREIASHTPGDKWQRTTLQEITVPPGTAAWQIIAGAEGAPGEKWLLGNIKIEYAPDRITVLHGTPATDLPPSKWSKMQAADCFFNRHTGKAARVRTSARVAFDNRNLYIGYICGEPDMSLLKANETKRDSKLWEDDCVEFFFFDPVANEVKQFIVNPNNVQFDCRRVQAQAGDPYKTHPWDGKWESKIWKKSHSWEVALSIPWQTLGFKTFPRHKVYLNIGRERAADNGKYMWNCYQGGFDEVGNYAEMDFQKKTLTRSRKVDKVNYLPKRARKVYKEVLTDIKKDWKCDMSANDFFLLNQTPLLKKKYNLQTWKKWQLEHLEDMGNAKIFGPVYPWVMHRRNTIITQDEFYAIHKKTGLTIPAHIDQSPPRANKLGAMPTFDSPPGRMRVDAAHPATIKSMCINMDNLADVLKKNPKLKEMISFLEGSDEPANLIARMYSRTRNPKHKAWLDDFSKQLKKEYGFGKFGLHDYFVPPTENAAFERIAFWRWWNQRYALHTKTLTEYAKEKLDLEIFVLCRNNCGALDEIDVALTANGKYVAGCDPYPTSAKASFGMARALYHTGFCTKLFRDLAPLATVVSYGQAFNYHGGAPTRAELREWVSQALKTGADYLRWYGGGALRQNPALFNEAYDISYQLQTSVPKLKLPTETKTAIYYSDYDRWGLNDRSAHAAYAVYSLLGEHNAFWFRFVSKHNLDLKNIKLLYIPRMRFTDPDLTAKLVKFVQDGGTIVVFDPDFMLWNIDKTPVPERSKLIGSKLVKKTLTLPRLQYGKAQLALSRIMHLPTTENDTLHAYDFVKLPAGAKVLASYPDGKPAIIERSFGKGKVIFSAVQPFGSSEVAVTPGAWKDFTAKLGKSVGEKDNLDIWFFELPEVKNKRFNIKYPN